MVYKRYLSLYYTQKGIIMLKNPLSLFVKQKRKETGMNQEELSFTAGVGLRFIRDLEQGKPTLRIDKVNQVLNLFGHELGPVKINRNEEG